MLAPALMTVPPSCQLTALHHIKTGLQVAGTRLAFMRSLHKLFKRKSYYCST